MNTARIALATASEVEGGLDAEGMQLRDALRGAGAAAEPAVWDDETVDWGAFDVVVVRSTWDYARRHDEFIAWTQRVSQLTRLHNPADVLAWNTDKRYLRDLAAAGVPIVPTEFLEPGDDPSAHDFLHEEHVVKPVVSAGSKDTLRFTADEPERSISHAGSLLDAGRVVMVQPYLASVDEVGETAVVVIGGTVSHAMRKGPLLTRGMQPAAGLFLQEEMSRRDAAPDELLVAERALAAVPNAADLLYARIDLLRAPDGPVVLELELTEPSLFLDHVPGSADRLAAAILAAVGR